MKKKHSFEFNLLYCFFQTNECIVPAVFQVGIKEACYYCVMMRKKLFCGLQSVIFLIYNLICH